MHNYFYNVRHRNYYEKVRFSESFEYVPDGIKSEKNQQY